MFKFTRFSGVMASALFVVAGLNQAEALNLTPAAVNALKNLKIYNGVIIKVTSMSCVDKTISATIVGGSSRPRNLGQYMYLANDALCSKISAKYDAVRGGRAIPVSFRVNLSQGESSYTVIGVTSFIDHKITRDGESQSVEIAF